jgi:hypothetical protein
MVSVEAASLLAQVLPVGVFVLILESRRGMRGYEDNNSVARVLKKIYWGLFIVGALGGLSATFSSVSAVVTNTPLDPVASILVLSEAALLYLAVVILAVTIAYEESGVNAATLRSVRRSQARKAARQGRHEAEDS